MTESEAAMQIGQNIGTLLVLIAHVPAAIAAPLVGLLSLGSFFFGKKYERKWNKKNSQSIPVDEQIGEDEQ